MIERRAVATVCLALGTVSLALTQAAHAQTAAQLAARHDLLEQAQHAEASGDHSQALELAQRAGSIQMTPSLRLFIANEEYLLGRLAPALGDSVECGRAAEHDPNLPNRTPIINQCHQLASIVEGRVGRVVVHVPDPPPAGLTVHLGGEVLDPVLYNVPTVVTPGDVVIEARDANGATFRQSVHVDPAGRAEVQLHLAAAAAATPTEASTTASHSNATTSSSTTQPPTESSPAPHATSAVATQTSTHAQESSHVAAPAQRGGGLGTVRLAGIAIAALGVVTAGTGGGIWAYTTGVWHSCQNMGGCDVSQEPRTLDTLGVGLFWGGLAITVAGAALFLFGPSGAPSGDHPTATLWIDPRGAAGIVGSF